VNQILCQTQENIAHVILNRPEKRNALNRAMISELHKIFCELAVDNSVGTIILSGNGPDFCAGADLDEMKGRDSKTKDADIENANRLMGCIEHFPKPVTAKMHGHALGGGLELALACHKRASDDSGIFGFPEITLGLWPAWGGTMRLPKLIGVERAEYLIQTGKRIGAAQAAEWGLVTIGAIANFGLNTTIFANP
jgi:enoyl-CoA hydratase/carnithine racemase